MRTTMRLDDHGLPQPPPQLPAALLTIEDLPVFGSDHLASLHRGLLVLLSVAILMLMPVIIWGGAGGRAWTEPQSRPSLGMTFRPTAPPTTQAPVPWEGDAGIPQGMTR